MTEGNLGLMILLLGHFYPIFQTWGKCLENVPTTVLPILSYPMPLELPKNMG